MSDELTDPNCPRGDSECPSSARTQGTSPNLAAASPAKTPILPLCCAGCGALIDQLAILDLIDVVRRTRGRWTWTCPDCV